MSAARMFCGCRGPMSSSAAAAVAKRKVATVAGAAESKKLIGIMRPVPVSDALRTFGGAAYISRAGAVKIVWDYIKEKGLQSPKEKRVVLCDAKLKTIFPGRNAVDVMEVTNLLSPHFVKTK